MSLMYRIDPDGRDLMEVVEEYRREGYRIAWRRDSNGRLTAYRTTEENL